MSKEAININDVEVDKLFVEIRNLIEESRNIVYKTINTEIINLHWNIGKMIIEKHSTFLLPFILISLHGDLSCTTAIKNRNIITIIRKWNFR